MKMTHTHSHERFSELVEVQSRYLKVSARSIVDRCFFILYLLNPDMNRPERDSVISVAIGQKQPSEQKLKQLESARKLAVESRKLKQRARLEAKLAQLRCLGDVSNEHLEKVCLLLVETEKDGRKRTNVHIEDINTNLEDLNEEIRAIRRHVCDGGRRGDG